jgi:hypothetical protein
MLFAASAALIRGKTKEQPKGWMSKTIPRSIVNLREGGSGEQ